jgi:hypothetical protein
VEVKAGNGGKERKQKHKQSIRDSLGNAYEQPDETEYYRNGRQGTTRISLKK